MSRADLSVETFLASVRALLVRTGALLGGLYAVAALSLVAALVPVLAWIFSPTRATSLAILGAAGLAAASIAVVALVLGGFAVRRRFAQPAAVARWVGTRAPQISSDLLSAVQLSAEANRGERARRGERADDDSAVQPPKPPAAPERNPWSAELAAALRASTERRLAELRPQALVDQRWVRRASTVCALAVLGHAAMWATASGRMLAGWRHLVVPTHLPFDASVLSDVPVVGDLALTLHFPSYTGRAAQHLPSTAGDISALVGTRVAIVARLLAPATKVEIVVEADDGVATVTPAHSDGARVEAELVVSRPGRYRFAVTDAKGKRTLEASARSLEALPDVAPTVQLIAPAESLDVSNLRQVELAYVAEDDFGIAAAELVWESGADHGKKPIPLTEAGQRAQGKILWDMSEVSLPAGADVRYWLEIKDNDTVNGPNVGRSRELRLKVISPRERHEQTLGKQQELAEHMLTVLGRRLVLAGDDARERQEIADKTSEIVVELGTLQAAYAGDVHASAALRKVLGGLRERIERWRAMEARLLAPTRGKAALKIVAARFAPTDAKLVAELEDGVTLLADWLDRERLEAMLDISDELAGHQKRLADLLEQYARKNDPRLRAEIERELRAIDAAMAQLARARGAMPEDVLDQFVHREALDSSTQASCMAEVRALFAAGDAKRAQAKLAQCVGELGQRSASLESSLDALRGDRFGDEQRKLDEVMNELADLARDQDDIAAEASRIFEEYAAKVDELSEENQREAQRRLAGLLDKLRRRLDGAPDAGLTPFAREELDIVRRRLSDLENMVDDGDLAEALAMAKQAKQSIDTIAGELDAALEDEPGSVFADDTERALESMERARPIAKELMEALAELAPAPRDVLSAEDKRALETLRRRQAAGRERGRRLGERIKQLGDELPGDVGKEMGQRLGTALDHMAAADGRMRALDPSGARQSARSAADALEEANKRGKGAARQRQESLGVGDEPIRIPGAEEYRAPEQFREDILEAMKKKVPSGYDDMLRRYYQELIR